MRAWVLNRDDRDFPAAGLDIARRLQGLPALFDTPCSASPASRRRSPRTVRNHLRNAYAKLGCSDRLLAVDRARRAGLLP
jgi:hypothetical protein